MNENYTKLKDFVQKRLGENSNNYDIRYWVGYMDGQNALYKKLCGSEEALKNQILKKPISDGRYYLCPCCLSDLGTWDDFLTMIFRRLNIAVIADVCLIGRR